MGKRKVKRPSPPRWMYYADLDDNCWACKNKRNCNSCKRVKEGLKERKIRSKRDQRQMAREKDENSDN